MFKPRNIVEYHREAAKRLKLPLLVVELCAPPAGGHRDE
jgi:hypothetical protein